MNPLSALNSFPGLQSLLSGAVTAHGSKPGASDKSKNKGNSGPKKSSASDTHALGKVLGGKSNKPSGQAKL